MTKQQVTDQQIAEQCGQKMLESDEASKSLGVSIIAIAPGQATIEMTIRQKMLNGHNTCHGGFLFTLADFAFAVACNSYNKIAVAASCNINFVRPAHVGDVLHASAVESYKSGRNGIYDVTVTDQKQQTIALFRGASRVISQSGPLDT